MDLSLYGEDRMCNGTVANQVHGHGPTLSPPPPLDHGWRPVAKGRRQPKPGREADEDDVQLSQRHAVQLHEGGALQEVNEGW